VLLVIDNYDSFTGNLLDAFARMGQDVRVVQHDRLDAAGLRAMDPAAVVLSPGPRTPRRAGRLMELLAAAVERGPVLGICLGHQAIGEAYGARLVRGREPVHGKQARVHHRGDPLFAGLPAPFPAMRYHSLVLEGLEGTPLEPIASGEDGTLMALRHRALPLVGVQFHPESVGTPDGPRLLANWCREAGLAVREQAQGNGYF
jgi:anthranilate synthase component 2